MARALLRSAMSKAGHFFSLPLRLFFPRVHLWGYIAPCAQCADSDWPVSTPDLRSRQFWAPIATCLDNKRPNLWMNSRVKAHPLNKLEVFDQTDTRPMRNTRSDFCKLGSCHKRQKVQASKSQAPIRNRQTRKVADAKVLNRNTNLT